MDTQSRNLVVPRGKMWFARYAAGTQNPGAFREFGNCPESNLTRETQTLTHYSSQAGLSTKDEELVITTGITGALTIDDIKSENVAYWWQSSVSTLSVSSATAIEETFLLVKVGDMIQLGRTTAAPSGARKVASVVVTDGGATTYVLGTDYTVDLDLGIIEMLVAYPTIEVTYNQTAHTREQIIAAETQIEGELKFTSINPVGAQRDITFPRVKLAPTGDFMLVNDPGSVAFQTMPLAISVLKKGNLALAYIDGRPI